MKNRRTSFPGPTAFAVIAAAALVGSGTYVTVSGQAPAPVPASPAAIDEYQSTVAPVLAKNCVSCHSDRLHTSNLSLEAFHDGNEALQKRDVWVKVLDKLKAGTMPPRSMPPMAAGDRDAVVGWIEKSLGVATTASVAGSNADPGRVTARRLNRTEYNNTIHDLLGVTLRPADEFPVDDSGYGFDNIGDVLSMSPMLMEKYMNAAKVVSRAAVFGEPYLPTPGLIVKIEGKKIQDDMQATGNITPYSARGSLFTTYHFPVDAEYEFHIRYQNFRGGEQVQQADGNGPARGRGRGAGAQGAGGQAGPAAAPETPGAQGPGQAADGGQAAPANPPANPQDPQAPAAGRGGRGRGGAPFVRRPLTEEERKARYEASCNAVPAEPLVFTIDGKQVYTYAVRGVSECEYSRGENIIKVRLTAGDHALRVSFPGYANMIDTNFAWAAQPEIVEGLTKLGLNPSDVKYSIISHAHGDHDQGAALLQTEFGAKVVMGAPDWEDTLKRSPDAPGGVPKRDISVGPEGSKVTLGDTTINIVFTPGHTPGTLSYIFPVKDGGRTVMS